MEKTFWGNDAAYNNLVNYVRMEHPAPLILLGKRGLGKKEAALSVASQILATGKEKIHSSGDFFILDKGRDPIRVEDVLGILEKSTVAPLGNANVFLVCHADRMNVQAQNKLLKLLEDRNSGNIVIFLCDQDMMIDTVKSRCMTVEFLPLSDLEMEDFLAAKGIDCDRSFIAHLCGNCPFLLEEIMPHYPSLKNIYEDMKGIKRREDLLGIFHLVQEKDPAEFYSLHADHYASALQMFQHLFYSLISLMLHMAPETASKGTGEDSRPPELWIRFADFNDYRKKVTETMKILQAHPGRQEIFVYLNREKQVKSLDTLRISCSESCMSELEGICGKSNICLKSKC